MFDVLVLEFRPKGLWREILFARLGWFRGGPFQDLQTFRTNKVIHQGYKLGGPVILLRADSERGSHWLERACSALYHFYFVACK